MYQLNQIGKISRLCGQLLRHDAAGNENMPLVPMLADTNSATWWCTLGYQHIDGYAIKSQKVATKTVHVAHGSLAARAAKTRLETDETRSRERPRAMCGDVVWE